MIAFLLLYAKVGLIVTSGWLVIGLMRNFSSPELADIYDDNGFVKLFGGAIVVLWVGIIFWPLIAFGIIRDLVRR